MFSLRDCSVIQLLVYRLVYPHISQAGMYSSEELPVTSVVYTLMIHISCTTYRFL